jgi:hypothetical protein
VAIIICQNAPGERIYLFFGFQTINLMPFPVAFLAFCVTVKSSIASSASFQIWTTFSTRRACLEDRRWNAFGLVSKYVISLTFFTAVFGNFAQVTNNANTRITTTPALRKSRHLDTENANVYYRLPH